jgi:hypothetical protein
VRTHALAGVPVNVVGQLPERGWVQLHDRIHHRGYEHEAVLGVVEGHTCFSEVLLLRARTGIQGRPGRGTGGGVQSRGAVATTETPITTHHMQHPHTTSHTHTIHTPYNTHHIHTQFSSHTRHPRHRSPTHSPKNTTHKATHAGPASPRSGLSLQGCPSGSPPPAAPPASFPGTDGLR